MGTEKKKTATKIKSKIQTDVASPKMKPTAAKKLRRKARRCKVE